MSKVAQNLQGIHYHHVKLFHYRINIPWRGGPQSPAWMSGMKSIIDGRSPSGKDMYPVLSYSLVYGPRSSSD